MSAVHDDHVEHVSMGLIQDFVVGIKILRISLGQDRSCRVQMLRVMSMRVMRIQGLNEVVLRSGNKDLILAEHGLKFLACEDGIKQILSSSPSSKIPSVMNKTYIIAFQVLPGPVDSRKLAVAGILKRNIVSLVVLLISEVKGISLRVPLALRADVDGKV